MEIQIQGITKQIKKQQILTDVNLTFSGVYGLLGPNGAGKTTLMKILASLLEFNTGHVYLDGESISTRKYVKQTNYIGYLPQDFMVYPDLTLYDVLKHIAILQGGKTTISSYHDQIKNVVEQVNLIDHLYKRMRDLSGGMRRRAGIAQLLLRQPDVLLFDEPTAGLDIEERIRFRNLLKQLGKRHTIIISSHIVEDIEFLCTKIGVLKSGEVIFEGAPEELKQKAADYIYEINVAPENLDEIIATKEVVQLSEEPSYIAVRVLSNQPIGNAVSPRLMDGYLALLREVSHG